MGRPPHALGCHARQWDAPKRRPACACGCNGNGRPLARCSLLTRGAIGRPSRHRLAWWVWNQAKPLLQVRLPTFCPRRRAPSPSDPPRPTLRRGRVCGGNGQSMRAVFGAGTSWMDFWDFARDVHRPRSRHALPTSPIEGDVPLHSGSYRATAPGFVSPVAGRHLLPTGSAFMGDGHANIRSRARPSGIKKGPAQRADPLIGRRSGSTRSAAPWPGERLRAKRSRPAAHR